MRAALLLLVVVGVSFVAGCIDRSAPPQVPEECKVTTDPAACGRR